MKEGTVIKSTGSWYGVRSIEGVVYQARMPGKFRLGGLHLTNPVAVGDLVHFRVDDEETQWATITKIMPRQNYIVRQSPRKKHQLHLLASNIDQAFLVVTIVNPALKPGVIDRFLLMTEPHNVPAVIIFNKSDLYDENDLELFEYLEAVYSSIGYQVFLTSGEEEIGIQAIADLLKDKTTLISGQSGVGKSTLINAIDPSLDLRTADLSDYSGKGQHTTTFAEMFALGGGYIIDTPGFKTLSFNNLEPMDVAHNFREFFQLSTQCKYPNCVHRDEPKCAVKRAVEEGEVSELRYTNYLKIIEEIEEQNYWERHKNL
jgi:ribosome biogenesis GTPase